jgi:hypothetical protein
MKIYPRVVDISNGMHYYCNILLLYVIIHMKGGEPGSFKIKNSSTEEKILLFKVNMLFFIQNCDNSDIGQTLSSQACRIQA